jgi:NADH-quinone oxidoreductase subunit N
VAAVPFHSWAPDVYEGAPTPIAGFMAVAVKAAAFFGLLRIIVVGMGDAAAGSGLVVPLLTGIAAVTIIGGNILALVQRNVKRMLAYSSVSHAGYAMIGMVAVAKGEQSAAEAVLFYLSAYTFMTLGAFGVLTFLERKEGHADSERYGAYAGCGFRYPALGLLMVLFMIALAGMPLTGGFMGKLYLFSAALKADLLPLVAIGILGSIISVYYYLRVVVAFYMRDVPDPGPVAEGSPSASIHYGLLLAGLGVLVLGLFPNSWLVITKRVIESLYLG